MAEVVTPCQPAAQWHSVLSLQYLQILSAYCWFPLPGSKEQTHETKTRASISHPVGKIRKDEVQSGIQLGVTQRAWQSPAPITLPASAAPTGKVPSPPPLVQLMRPCQALLSPETQKPSSPVLSGSGFQPFILLSALYRGKK